MTKPYDEDDYWRQYTDGAVGPPPPSPGRRGRRAPAAPHWRERVFSARDLQHKIFEPISYVVEGLIPDGVAMLAGRPKTCKSWMALEIGLAVASEDGATCLGGREVVHGDVLYCACEDSQRRLQDRITKLLGVYGKPWPKNLQLATGWPRLDKGGVADIAEWIKSVENPRLVILDTLASVKPQRSVEGYSSDYAALEELHHLVNEVGIAVLILHHQRKNDAEDPLDTISGTLGLAGCVDTPIVLAGTSQGMTLYVRGRDIEEAEHALAFDKATCRWVIRGDAADVQRSDTRKKILAVLAKIKPNTMGPQEVAAAADLGEAAVKKRLGAMLADGEVIKTSRGEYAHA